MLYIKNLSASVEKKSILHDLSLLIDPGQTHVLMGQNGSGKSSLAYTLMGHPAYEVTVGSISWLDQDLLSMPVYERSLSGLFLAVQQPQIIPGLQVINLLRELCRVRSEDSFVIKEFLEKVKLLLELVGLQESFLYRSVNEGFSGGEKKRFELLQMLLLQPKLAILDEIDSGVDIDGLKALARGLQWYKKHCPQSSLLIVTHYRKILEHIEPEFVHVMMQGKIVKTGSNQILEQIEQGGYEQYATRS